MSRGAVRLAWSALIVLAFAGLAVSGCASGAGSAPSGDGNPALTAAVHRALATTALLTNDQVTSVTSTADGAVTVTLWKNSEELWGPPGSEAVATAAAAGKASADDLLKLVTAAKSVEVRDADGKVLATATR